MEEEREPMTVREAGRLGGQKTAATHGTEFYSTIGKKGGRRVKALLEKGLKKEREERREKG